MINELSERLAEVEKSVRELSIATKKVLTFEEASCYTGLSKSWLYKLTSTKQVPYYKPCGKLCFFDRCELEQWIMKNRIVPDDEINENAICRCMRKKERVNYEK